MPETSHRSFAKTLLAPLLRAFLLFTAPALAETDCTSTPHKIGLSVTHEVPDAKAQHLTGADAAHFVATLNAIPPETHNPGDEVLIFRAPGKPRPLVVIFYRGCMIDHGTMSEAQLRKLMDPGA